VKSVYYTDHEIDCVAGVDEAGRGPLAGPVITAAVILGERIPLGLGDSKQKTALQRERLFEAIMSSASAVGIGRADVAEIDHINILQATLCAMQRAVAALSVLPVRVLIDGNRCPLLPYPSQAIVAGDASVPAISAASIVAKVTRDRLMHDLDTIYPVYGFSQHKGYPTAQHIAALMRHGPSPAHRLTFAPVRRAIEGRALA
jgi:ribonuclease HII